MDRAQKEGGSKELGQILRGPGVVVVAHYEGLSVAEMTDFRLRLKQAGAGSASPRTSSPRSPCRGPPSEDGESAEGHDGARLLEDPVAAAKAVDDFTKVNRKLVVLGGAMGATPLDEAGVKAVAAMPSRGGADRSIVASIGAPAAQLASAIGAPAANIAAILTALEEREAA